MTYHNVQFPTLDEYGTSGGPGNSTAIVSMDSGQSRRITRWGQFRHNYDVAWQIKTHATLSAVKTHYLSRGGVANTFPYKDWADYNTTVLGHNWEGDSSPVTDEDQEIGIGDGTTTQFQLIKRYEDAGGSYVRNLKRIVPDSTVIAIDGTPTASGWTVNELTGVVTFDVAPTLAQVVTAGCEFYVEVRYGDGVDKFFAANIDDFGSGSLPNLPLIEELDGTEIDEDRHFGGARGPLEYSAAITLDLGSLVWTLDPQAINLKAFLPDIDDVPLGGPLLILSNVAGPSVFVRDAADTTNVAVIGTGTTTWIFAGLDSAGARDWFAFEFA